MRFRSQFVSMFLLLLLSSVSPVWADVKTPTSSDISNSPLSSGSTEGGNDIWGIFSIGSNDVGTENTPKLPPGSQAPVLLPGSVVTSQEPMGPQVIFPPQVQPTQLQQNPQVSSQQNTQQVQQANQGMGTQTMNEIPELERFISGALPTQLMANISRYGIDFFKAPPSTFAPDDAVPVGPDYVIGPGDTFRIDVWGMVQGTWTVTVDRNGQISVPTVGTFGVAGLTFDHLKTVLRRELGRYWSNFDMNVTMGQLRTIKVYVTGQAQKPGAYTVSSLSTLVNALLASGGPSYAGTMRDIQVKRHGKIVTHFDMYDFLMHGDKTKDIRLQPEDVIYIPRCGPLVAIVGNVMVPAIYELKNETRLSELLSIAGGLSSTGFAGRIQIFRVKENAYRSILEGDMVDLKLNLQKDFILKDGDLIRIFNVVEKRNLVTITGPVAKPGQYGVDPGKTTVRDVLLRAGGLLENASDIGEITRISATQQGPKTERIIINYKKALEGDPSNNITLELNDFLFVRSVPEWELYRTVNISGEVKYPGTYSIIRGERLSSLIERAGGYTERAYLRGAVFTRNSVRELQEKQNKEMIDQLEMDLISTGTNELSSSVNADEAKMAQYATEQKRRLIDKLRTLRAAGRVVLPLGDLKALKGGPYDIVLEDGDALYIPSNPQTIQVLGAVLNPSAFVYRSGMSIADYLKEAGGFAAEASPGRIYLLKADGTAMRIESSGWPFKGSALAFNRLEPGDAIIVPQKVSSYAGLRETRDWIDVIFKIAMSAAAVHNVTD